MTNKFQDGIRLQRENAELRADNKKLRGAINRVLNAKGEWNLDPLHEALSQTEPKEES